MSGRRGDRAAVPERVVDMLAAQASAARRRRLVLGTGAVGVVVIVLAGLVVARAADVGTTRATTRAGFSTRVSPAVLRAISAVPASVLNRVGAGHVQAVPRKIDAPALTAGGKPKVLYVGAEYCPFCAAQRWPVVVALARFGTWTGLRQTTSASGDVDPDTATLSFHGAGYRSRYLSFTGVETAGRVQVNGQFAPLDRLSAADQRVTDTYDRAPYTAGPPGSIPFIDLGGSYVSSGASFDPQLLAGKSHRQVAATLADPTSPVAQAVDGAANVLTVALCEITDQLPAEVCTAPGVRATAAVLRDKQR